MPFIVLVRAQGSWISYSSTCITTLINRLPNSYKPKKGSVLILFLLRAKSINTDPFSLFVRGRCVPPSDQISWIPLRSRYQFADCSIIKN